MAFSLVQAWASNQATSGTTSALVLVSVPLAGDVLVATYSMEAALTGTIADNIGDGVPWTVAINGALNSLSSLRFYLAYKIVGTPSGGLKTVTMTLSGTIVGANAGVAVAEYAATGAISLDGAAVSATGQSATESPGTITTTSSAGLVVGINHNNASYPTVGAGFTGQLGTPNVMSWKVSTEDKVTTAGGTYDATWTGGASDFWISLVIGFQQSSGHSFVRRRAAARIVLAAALIGSIVVNWLLPTTLADGSPISGLIGTKIYKSQTQYDQSPTLALTVASAVATTATVTGLTSGTWYFWASSYTALGESELQYIGTGTV